MSEFDEYVQEVQRTTIAIVEHFYETNPAVLLDSLGFVYSQVVNSMINDNVMKIEDVNDFVDKIPLQVKDLIKQMQEAEQLEFDRNLTLVDNETIN